MLIPKRKQPGFFCPQISSYLSLQKLSPEAYITPSATRGDFCISTKTSARRAETFVPLQKLQRGTRRLLYRYKNFSATRGDFCTSTKTSARRAETFASLQKLQRGARRLLYRYRNPSATGKVFICIKNGLPANLYSKDSFLPGGHLHSQDLSSMSAESDGQRPDLLPRHINIRHRRLPVIYNLKPRPGYD